MKNKYFLGMLVFTLVWTNVPVCSLADEQDEAIEQTQQTISNLEKQTKETRDAISSLQGQKQQTQANVNNLQNQRDSLQSEINGYSSQLNTLNGEISDTEVKLSEVSAQIIELENQLSEAKAQEKDRYDMLKLRLKSTYENGGDKGFLRMIFFGSNTLKDILTKAEYLDAIMDYDNRKIDEFQVLQQSIREKTEEVKQKEAEIDAYQDQLDAKYDKISSLTDTVRGQLNTTKNSLSSEQGKLEDYDKKLSELDARMKELEAKSAAAQAQLAQQLTARLARSKEDTSGSYAASADELTWLAATIQAEADGESYTGKLGVGSVIMNRVKSSAFPNSVIGVITQAKQFASYRSGKVELIISSGPNSTCIQAAQEVLNGKRTGDYLFFMTRYWADYYGIADYTMVGNHAFFYRWVVKEKPPEEPEQTEEAPAEEPHEEEHHEEEHHEEENNDDEDSDDGGDDDDEDDE